VSPAQRLEGLVENLAELTGQRNAIDGQIVDIVAEIDRDELWGATGARSVPALVAWKTGVSPHNADTIVAVAHRIEEFPRCAKGMREGRFSLDQVCPYHHRAHHRGAITITGPAPHLVVTDQEHRPLKAGSLARPPTTPPPPVKPCQGPTGERAQWWWYQPFQPQPPP
jgi:hypothetical protein